MQAATGLSSTHNHVLNDARAPTDTEHKRTIPAPLSITCTHTHSSMRETRTHPQAKESAGLLQSRRLTASQLLLQTGAALARNSSYALTSVVLLPNIDKYGNAEHRVTDSVKKTKMVPVSTHPTKKVFSFTITHTHTHQAYLGRHHRGGCAATLRTIFRRTTRLTLALLRNRACGHRRLLTAGITII